MSPESDESRRLLRSAAERAVDEEEDRRVRDERPVGSQGWWTRDPRGWERVGLLDAIEDEYGFVAKWWIVGLREAVLLSAIFWLVAVVLGFVVEASDVVGVGSWAVDVVVFAAVLTVALRLVATGVSLLARRLQS